MGAATEVEMKERKLRIEDALAATRAAVEEGIVPGGGTSFISAIKAVRAHAETLSRALEEPIRQIAANAGIDGAVVVDKVMSNGSVGFGYDAKKGEYCDMVDKGIIDPTKVSRSALQNAASVSSVMLTTECLVADIPAPEPAAPAAPGGMGGMY